MSAPCLCGHAFHFQRGCDHEGCSCPTGAPDYVAAQAEVLAAMPEQARGPYREILVNRTRETALALGYRGPGTVLGVCSYCTATFTAWRKHARTCSGACRQAYSVARRYEYEADIPATWARCDTYSEERARATGGYGCLTASEQYEHDLRVWREARASQAA